MNTNLVMTMISVVVLLKMSLGKISSAQCPFRKIGIHGKNSNILRMRKEMRKALLNSITFSGKQKKMNADLTAFLLIYMRTLVLFYFN